jgi:hypothetical protein
LDHRTATAASKSVVTKYVGDKIDKCRKKKKKGTPKLEYWGIGYNNKRL